MTYLFFDTETAGLPLSRHSSVTELSNWPRLVQLAYLVYEDENTKIASGNYIVRPEGFNIPAAFARIHGITNDRALQEGIPLFTILEDFTIQMARADYLVAHNMAFDEKIIGAELLRSGIPDSIACKSKICIMEQSADFCACYKKNRHQSYKWPKLSELYYQLFSTKFSQTHNAATDVSATAQCFWELKKRNTIQLP